MIFKYKKNYYLIILFIFILTHYIFAGDKEEYRIELQNCIDKQKELSEAIAKYQSDNKIRSIKIVSEDDYQSLINKLSDENYLNNFQGISDECSYRYSSDNYEIYCIKHGSIKFAKEFVEGCQRYKEAIESKEKSKKDIRILGVVFIICAILF